MSPNPSVLSPKFVSLHGILVYELRNRKDTSKSTILVWLLNRHTSAANLNFLSVSRQVRDRNLTFKAATQIDKLLELL